MVVFVASILKQARTSLACREEVEGAWPSGSAERTGRGGLADIDMGRKRKKRRLRKAASKYMHFLLQTEESPGSHEVIIGEAGPVGKIRFPAFLAGSTQTRDRFRPTTRI